MWRETYRRCADPEIFLVAPTIRELLAEVGNPEPQPEPRTLAATLDAVAAWSDEQAGAYRDLIASAEVAGALPTLVHAVLRQSAPLASVLGAWLQGMSAPAVFEDVVHLQVLSLFADDIGVGRPRSSRHDAFKLLAKQWGRPELAVEADELVAVRPIRDHMFALPATVLAVSRRSDEFAPFIAGIDVVMRSIGILPCWDALRSVEGTRIDLAGLDLRTPTGATAVTAPLDVSRAVADEFAALSDDTRRQVEMGAAWVLRALRSWDQLLLDEAAAVLHPRRAMEQLVRERAREGAVYHHGYAIGGGTLSQLLERAKTDPDVLLDELAQTRLVKPGNAGRSALVNGLIGPKGPMFRVFSGDDVEIISNWIDWLGDADAAPALPSVAQAPAVPDLDALQAGETADEGVTPNDIREAFFVLQGRALAPATRSFAVRYVRRWLSRAKLSLGRGDRSLPATWTRDGLRPWLLDMHDRQSDEFDASASAELPSREALIDSTLQLAPLTLIDGAWLQGFTDASLATTHYGYPLFETFWDELGNGDIEINHPKIYRDVLRAMGIELAPTGTREFAYDERIREESLERPVYWLCLGKLPRTFLPEILGMNLAMELSGVGGSYRTARTFLAHHGFPTQFVDLHNTIDNVSTGHSAWAADAIDTHMRAVAALADPEEFAAEWERVRIGFESLSPRPSKVAELIGTRFQPTPWKPRSQDRALLHHRPVRIS